MRNVKKWNMAWLSLVAVLCLCLPWNTWAAPKEVTIFPDSALVVESKKVKIQADGKDLRKAVFVLPAHADPETLSTRLPDGSKVKIEDQTWRQIVRQNDDRIADIGKQLENVKNDRRNLQSVIQSLNTQIQFWQLQTKAKMKTLPDANNMSVAIGKNIKKTYHDKLNQELELAKLDKKVKELQDELDRTAGQKETAWEVTVLFSGHQVTETLLTYTYSMSGCGWLPLYRLEAKPGDKKISFTWEADIWQSSGEDWKQVVTNLATLKPTQSILPSDFPPWVIKPRSTVPYYFEKKAARAKAAEDYAETSSASNEAPAPALAAPQQIRQSTYAVWQVGRKIIPAGSRQRVKLQEEIWPAEFSYVIRPGLSPRAFVRASIRLPEAREVPSGSATFMVDGAILGKRDFSLAGQEATLYFGVDPLVKAERTLLSKKAGEKGLLSDKQTYAWEWRIDVTNFKNDSARVIIEEPNPQLRDERIKLTLKHTPEPSEKTPLSLIWNLDMTAGQKKTISSSVSLEAPGDMNLDLGWQR